MNTSKVHTGEMVFVYNYLLHVMAAHAAILSEAYKG